MTLDFRRLERMQVRAQWPTWWRRPCNMNRAATSAIVARMDGKQKESFLSKSPDNFFLFKEFWECRLFILVSTSPRKHPYFPHPNIISFHNSSAVHGDDSPPPGEAGTRPANTRSATGALTRARAATSCSVTLGALRYAAGLTFDACVRVRANLNGRRRRRARPRSLLGVRGPALCWGCAAPLFVGGARPALCWGCAAPLFVGVPEASGTHTELRVAKISNTDFLMRLARQYFPSQHGCLALMGVEGKRPDILLLLLFLTQFPTPPLARAMLHENAQGWVNCHGLGHLEC
ncbi:uncharacterized protein LOC129696035 [Leucoraja erinacea]|uniref:uncharacterized protein LOC129696035 n=1 Tax=Leucoraja erinaceus TaxID=7782 RepID=UPI002457A7B5|nr:uncharacterized protein LOC129696035 [Leucoraja erinacea]